MDLSGCRMLLIAANEGMEETEIVLPMRALQQAGARVDVTAPKGTEIHLFRRDGEANTQKVEMHANKRLEDVAPASYDALLLTRPLDVDKLAPEAAVKELVLSMQAAGKPVISVHGTTANPPTPTPAAKEPSLREINWGQLLADSVKNWDAINAPRLGASLAYYTILSMAPLLVILVAIAGFVFGKSRVEQQVVGQLHLVLGGVAAESVRLVLQSAHHLGSGILATSLGILTLLFGASGVFLDLRDSLNIVWGVRPTYGSGLQSLIRTRSFSFLLVLGTGFLLVVSLAVSAIVAATGKYFAGLFPAADVLVQAFTLAVSFATITLLFALIYKVVPDIQIDWADVWIGAAVTSILFTIGKFLLGLYLGKVSVGSSYGAAGSLIVVLVWVYYSAQIFLLGAEFTHVYAKRHGTYSSPASPQAGT